MADLSIRQVLEKHTARLMSLEGVVGVAEGRVDNRPAVQVHLASDDDALRRKIPDNIEGHPVQIIVTGPAELF